MMTTDDLRALVQQKPAAELTPEECAALRAAIRRSPELLRELAERIQIDEYLAQALGRPQVSAERVLARLAARRARALGVWTRYGLAVCGAVAVLLGGLVAIRGWRPRPEQVARREADQPAAAVQEVVAVEPPPPSRPAPRQPAPAIAPLPAEPEAPVAPAVVTKPAVPAEPLREVGLFEPAAAADATFDDTSLARWFAAVDTLPLRLSVQAIEGKSCGRIDGVARLARPLVDGAALRMASNDFTGLRIHVWSGRKGVTFGAFPTPLRWVVHATTRGGSEPLPTGYLTLGFDDGRMIRTNPGVVHQVELRYADGMVTLARGDVRLVEAPLDGPPTDVFFEGGVIFRDLAMVAARPVPPLRPPAARPGSDLLAAGRGRWVRGGDPTAGFTVHEDGAVTLTAVDTKQHAWAVLPLPAGAGLREVVVRLEGAMPGTGLVFGDAAAPQTVLMFVANKNLPGLVQITRKPPADAGFESVEQPAAQSFVFVKDTLWLRIRQCGGVQRIDFSPDGTRWITHAEPQPAFAALGVIAVPHPSARSITVAALQEAPLARLESLAPTDLRAAAVGLSPAGPFAAWLAAADAAKPPIADAGAWRRACGLKALADNASKDLAIDLLAFLFRESLGMDMPPAARRDLLDDVMALAPVIDDPAGATRIAALFESLGAHLAMQGEPRCFTAIGHDQLTAPLRCGQPFTVFSEPLARREILGLLCRGDWDAARGLLERLTFFGFSAKPRNDAFFAWAAAATRSGSEGKPGLLAPEWRPPLLVSPSKESLSVAAELNAALDAEEFLDVCRLIDAAATAGEVDVLQDRRDAAVCMSLPVAVAAAMRDEPRLLETMRQERERIAGLRVLEATASGAAAVETAVVQFHGTRAAGKAYLWLADRALSGGLFPAAVRRYEAALEVLPAADEQQRKRVQAGLDLARQLQGVTTPPAPPAGTTLAKAAAVTATGQSRLEGDVGVNPGAVPPPLAQGGVDWPPLAIDWAARQIAVLPLADRLLVANRFQVASHDPATGAVQWRAGLGGDAAGTHDWPGHPMRPVADATRAYVRRLRKAGPAVAAINRGDGVVAWELPSTPDRLFVSDPLPADHDTLAICVARPVDDSFAVALASLDAATGAVLREVPLVSLRGGWRAIGDCQLAADAGVFCMTAGGAVIACEADGRLRWARRETWLPPPIDAGWMLTAQSPPVCRDGRLHVVQPGVPGLVTLEAATGRLLWRLDDVAVSRIRGTVGGRLVVERIGTVAAAGASRPGHADLIGVDAATGTVAWRFGPAELLDASLVADDGVLLAVREPVAGKATRVAVLVRLDPATGRETHRWPLAATEDPLPCLGPFLPSAGGLRVFFGRGPGDPTRDLLLLTPGGP